MPDKEAKSGKDDKSGKTTGEIMMLRSGHKLGPAITKARGFRRNPNALVPPQTQRTTLGRKGMTRTTTEMMARSAAGVLDQQREVAAITDWTSVSSFADTPEYKLKDNNTARCHILADSNVKTILLKMITSMRENQPISRQAREAMMAFVRALNALEADDLIAKIELHVQNQPSADLGELSHRLSHGADNLFFGNAQRNEFILTGLDVPFHNGKPDPRAGVIREAVIALARHGLIDMNLAMTATSVTYDRRDGLAVSSSSQMRYDPSEVFDACSPGMRKHRRDDDDDPPGGDFKRANSAGFARRPSIGNEV